MIYFLIWAIGMQNFIAFWHNLKWKVMIDICEWLNHSFLALLFLFNISTHIYLFFLIFLTNLHNCPVLTNTVDMAVTFCYLHLKVYCLRTWKGRRRTFSPKGICNGFVLLKATAISIKILFAIHIHNFIKQ